MAARDAPRRPIGMGDIVLYEGEHWTVVGRLEEPGLPGRGPAADLRLERTELVPAETPFGRPQRWRKQRHTKKVTEGRVRLVASQAAMFG
jgi:hypothetical protein